MKPAWIGFLLSLSLCLDLGIVNVAILRTSLQKGGTAGFLVGLGSSAGDMVYFTLAVFGAAALLRYPPVRWGLWVAGTCTLLFLAWRMLREVFHPRDLHVADQPAPQGPAFTLFATGCGLALASPSAILWFAAVGGSVIASFSDVAGGSRIPLWSFAAGFLLAGLLWSAAFAYGIAAVRHAVGPRMARILSMASAVLFLYFAAVVFLDGLRQLVG